MHGHAVENPDFGNGAGVLFNGFIEAAKLAAGSLII